MSPLETLINLLADHDRECNKDADVQKSEMVEVDDLQVDQDEHGDINSCTGIFSLHFFDLTWYIGSGEGASGSRP